MPLSGVGKPSMSSATGLREATPHSLEKQVTEIVDQTCEQTTKEGALHLRRRLVSMFQPGIGLL